VSRDTELKMSEMAFQNLMTRYSDKLLPSNHQMVNDVRRVATNLIKSSGLPAVEQLDWQFYVVDDPRPNAFVLPGGRVCLFTGLFPVMKDDDGMAVVLSHEIAHIAARHGAEHWSSARYWVAADSACRNLGMARIADSILHRVVGSEVSRSCETEADHIGFMLMAKGCYDVRKAPQVWHRMKQFEDINSQSHPSIAERIEALNKLMPEAQSQQRTTCQEVHSFMCTMKSQDGLVGPK